MRRIAGLVVSALVVASAAGPPAVAQTFNSGSTGADGAFSPTANTTLSLPPSGVFNFTTKNGAPEVTAPGGSDAVEADTAVPGRAGESIASATGAVLPPHAAAVHRRGPPGPRQRRP